jgi:hypothetical protein
MSVYANYTMPCTTQKHPADGFDKVKVVPSCHPRFYAHDGDIVREMTQAEKEACYPPVIPTLDEVKIRLINEGESRTKDAYAAGVPAHVGSTVYLFDTRVGERAAIQWQLLDSIITKCLLRPMYSAVLFPRNVNTMNDEHVLELPTLEEAEQLWVDLMTSDNNIALVGSTYRKAVRDSLTVEEALAVVDPRA